jgi:hypothetical protein
MNPSTYSGFGTGVVDGGAITSFQQTGPFFSSFNFTLPPGVKRFEAMLVGGGGGGYPDWVDQYGNGNGYGAGGGFGGLAIFRIPIYLEEMSLVVGAGGVPGGGNGGATSLQLGSIVLARVGGGGGGGFHYGVAGSGRYGGHGGAGGRFDYAWGGSGYGTAGDGGEPCQGEMIWNLNADNTPGIQNRNTGANTNAFIPMPYHTGWREGAAGGRGYYGAGNAGCDSDNNPAYRSCGGWGTASYGGGSRGTNSGFGSNLRIWGFNLPSGNFSIGGPGIFGPNSGINGGPGGGGGGATSSGGTGGVGAAVFRYYF